MSRLQKIISNNGQERLLADDPANRIDGMSIATIFLPHDIVQDLKICILYAIHEFGRHAECRKRSVICHYRKCHTLLDVRDWMRNALLSHAGILITQ